ncbi:hypothetical protein ACEUBT_19135 [Aeromonas bivalvium]|uniref:hypothetical protein n=1 Tax=Aeromonas bivalvium TaxID=440079 RepID=UPI0038CFED8E
MKRANIFYVTISVLVLFSSCLAVWIHYLNEGKDLLNFTISIVGFCIALLALFISVRTYTSIDSVNNISKMDGNILDNENYVTSLPELISHFKSQDEKDLDNKIFESIEYKLKKESHTAVHFADTLQYIIDLIVIFPAVFNASDTDRKRYKERMESILRNIDKRRKILYSISKGNSIQITESIKLFKAVVAYQHFVSDGNFNIHADLLHVRGPILRNPVTKTIYHNYLGLYYNKKGMHLLREFLKIESKDMLSIEGLNLINTKLSSLTPPIREEITMYLTSACKQFDKAIDISKEDVMWPGFINYNKSRTLYFLSSLSTKDNSWLDIIDDAIDSRSRLNRLIDEILTTNSKNHTTIKNTHLRQFFLYQEELARMVKLNILLTEKDKNNSELPLLYRGLEINKIHIDDLKKSFIATSCFPIIKSYQDMIIEKMQEKTGTPSMLRK